MKLPIKKLTEFSRRVQSGKPFVKCAVQGCASAAECELAVEGEWFPICNFHSVNRLLPRRALRTPERKEGA
jgi:hypothetical protein